MNKNETDFPVPVLPWNIQSVRGARSLDVIEHIQLEETNKKRKK
jgi:hypothetical protein